MIADTAHEALLAFFVELGDVIRCRACHEPLDLKPTVVISISERNEYLYCPGDHLLDAPDLQKQFEVLAQSGGRRLEAFLTLRDLRTAFAKRIASMVERVVHGIKLMSKDLNKVAKREWQGFTSSTFAAAVVALSTPLPGFTIDLPCGKAEALHRIACLQATIWLALCHSWSGEVEPGRTLETDLLRYVVPESIFSAASDKFLEFTEESEHSWPQPLVVRFCLEAIRASLHSWCNRPNPRAREWADLFVEQEVERRLLGERSPPHLIAMEIGAQRARDTISYEGLFDSCLSQMGRRGIRIRPELGAIGRKMGYPDLEEELEYALRIVPKADRALSVDEFLQSFSDVWKDGQPEALERVMNFRRNLPVEPA